MKLSYQTHKVDFIFFNEIQLLYNVVLVSAVQQSKSAMLLLRRFSRVQLCATPQTAAHQAPRPWDSPGKNTGVGCHFLLQCMKVKSESEVAQSCLTPSDSMDCSLPGCSIHGIFQARVLEWGAIAFSNIPSFLDFLPIQVTTESRLYFEVK